MVNELFRGIFSTDTETIITVSDFLLCLGVSLFTGFFLAAVYTFRNRWSKSFVITLAMLPAAVCVVIMTVNGNIGAGVAVAGAFGLVRFRSAPGSAKDIAAIFLAMGTGLIAGMGYLAYSVLFAVVMGVVLMLLTLAGNSGRFKKSAYRTLKITIPEDLDYTDVFDDILKKYTSSYEVTSVRTVNMGSLFRLTYDITLKDIHNEKKFIDELRCRNGNLEINMSRQETGSNEL